MSVPAHRIFTSLLRTPAVKMAAVNKHLAGLAQVTHFDATGLPIKLKLHWLSNYPNYAFVATGKVNVNILPLPLPALFTSTRPEWDSIIALTIARPSPVPPLSRLRDLSAR